ncbi:glucose 1-dehydrogenase [Sciscionella sediminilitoris]|uniref:glucose 1-dehydrogenase n=1 Tax=Sciscionella sediminilitoris TaxID=1445613 RepID=UPI0004DF4F71|nr:glucose 1-dehydrogenase [Sciscionella sp. SE31]
MTKRLEGKIAIITGAASGMGAATARRYIEEGARVLVADIGDEAGEKHAAELGENARFCHLDVSEEDDWQAAVAACTEAFGAPNVLVNAAGVLHFAMIEHCTLADYRRLVDINQIGTLLGMRSVIAPMRAGGGGSIVNFSSIEGLGALQGAVAYASTKFAIRGMTKVAALELGVDGIRVNSVHPGMVETPMIGAITGGAKLDFTPVANRLALRRIGKPEEIANLVVFLGSEESSYSTGAEFVADGGATATHVFGANVG